jgi:hypothetical protein
MASQLNDLVGRWVAATGVDPARAPTASALAAGFAGVADPCRPAADLREIDDWERRHGHTLPLGLRTWLSLSNGFYLDGPLIHPLSAIGPMVPFARVPDLLVQPESWFELGNPNVETVCIDLAYSWPGGGGGPIFTSGDDLSASRPRVIATGFDDWFLTLLHGGGREYWFDPDFLDLGDPWEAHRRYTPAPPLSARLRRLATRVEPLIGPGADDRAIATTLGITRVDVERIMRHIQHGPHGVPGS